MDLSSIVITDHKFYWLLESLRRQSCRLQSGWVMKSFIYKQCLINECLFSMSWVILLKIFIWSKIERHNISMTYDRNMILPISRRYNKNLDFKFITLSFLVLSYPNHKSFIIFFCSFKKMKLVLMTILALQIHKSMEGTGWDEWRNCNYCADPRFSK